MKKILVFIVLLLFLLLLWYSNNKYHSCCDGVAQADDVEHKKNDPLIEKKEKLKNGPLMYNWNSAEAITNELWNAKRSEILANESKGNVLQISAPYFEKEGKELGIERAKSVFLKLASDLDPKKVEYTAKLVNYFNDAEKQPFEGTDFKWLVRNENISEIDEKTLIYFPKNSTKQVRNENIKNYILKVANFLKTNDKNIVISGHTDNTGNSVNNKKLALKRAKSIKNELISLGVNANRIVTISYGDKKPIASNDNKLGRQKNRRVELEIK